MNLEVNLSDGEINVRVSDIHPIAYDEARRLARDLTLELAGALNVPTDGDG